MKKYIFLLVFFAVGLFSCQSNTDKEETITFWSSNNPTEIDFIRFFAKKWNATYKETVHFQPIPEGQSSEEVIMAAVVGKTTPDIYANMWQGLVEMYAKSGVLIPLDTISDFKEFITARCGEKTLEEITSSDGHIYQVPWKINPAMMIYNEKHISSLGLSSPPNTYSEFLQAGADFAKDKDGDGYVDQWIGYTEIKNIWHQRLWNFYPLYLAASGGAPLVKNNEAAFNNEYAIGVFRFLQELYANNYFAKETFSAGGDKFLGEQLATKWTGPWEIAFAEKFKPEDFQYNFVPLPVPDNHQGVRYTYADPKNMVIFNTCKNPTKAWEFIKTLVDEKGDLKLLELTEQLPRRQKLSENEQILAYINEHPKIMPFIKQSEFVYGADNCEVLIEVLDIISQEYESCVIHNKKTPEKAIADAAKAVNVLLGN